MWWRNIKFEKLFYSHLLLIWFQYKMPADNKLNRITCCFSCSLNIKYIYVTPLWTHAANWCENKVLQLLPIYFCTKVSALNVYSCKKSQEIIINSLFCMDQKDIYSIYVNLCFDEYNLFTRRKTCKLRIVMCYQINLQINELVNIS